MYKTLKKLFIITAASLVYAAGISLFLDPNNLAPGGVTGIAVILNRITMLPTGTLYFLLNLPILGLGLWIFGWRLIILTGYSILVTSVFTNHFSSIGAVTKDPLLAAIAGSVLIAVGMAYTFKAGATTGGMDIIIKIIRLRRPHLKTGFLFLVTDLMVILWAGFIFKNTDIILYAILAVYVSGKVIDMVLYGSDEARMIFIISKVPDQISERLLEEIDTGVTYIKGIGGYSNENKKIVMCVVKKQQAPKIEEIVKEEDSSAFMIVTCATEIFGEGYKSFYAEKL